MNKYLELMYEQAAERNKLGELCPFCIADDLMEKWFLSNFPECDPLDKYSGWCGCIFCPHAEYADLEFVMEEGDVTTNEDDPAENCYARRGRVWRKYRDFFEGGFDEQIS